MPFLKWTILSAKKAYMRYRKHSYWKVCLKADYNLPLGRRRLLPSFVMLKSRNEDLIPIISSVDI